MPAGYYELLTGSKTMVFTLHRYIFRELFKVFALATIALTLMMSLGSMYRPIQEYGVGPEQVFHLLGYFLPITLTFVLPMSALFAASLVYGRFASDNELDACRASGISIMTLIYPGLCLGILVSITTLVLSFHVVPAFVHKAEKTIKANAKQILFRNIQRKGYYTIPGGRFRIFADYASSEEDILEGVVIVETKARAINKLYTAQAARIVFDLNDNINKVSILAKETFKIDESSQFYQGEFTLSSEFQSLLSDDIKFQRIDDIKRIQSDMMNFYPIRQLARNCRAQMAIELLNNDIAEKLNEGPDSSYRFDGENRIVLFKAAGCTTSKDWTINLQGPITLVEYDKDLRTEIRRWKSNEGTIKLENELPGSQLELNLKSPSYSGDIEGFAQQHVVKIPLPDWLENQITEDGLLDKIKMTGTEASPLKNPSKDLVALKGHLQYLIVKTISEIYSEVHSRLVFGLGCSLLILTGIALGVIFKGGHLLTAFGTSSIPAAILIVCIMTGKEFTKNPSTPMIVGPIVMWVGLAGLSVLTFAIYRKLLKT